jgi:hypothetical protein
MAEIKISQLVTSSSHFGDDVLMILQNGINKKTSLTTVLKNLNSYDDIRINPLQSSIRTTISSKNIEKMFYVDGVNDKIGIGTGTLSDHLLTINGSVSIGNASSNGILAGSSEEILWSSGDPTKALSTVRQSSYLQVQVGYTGSFSLADGFDGQLKTITLMTASSGNTTISCNGIGGTFSTINMSAIGSGITLIYKSSGSIHGWCCVGANGATFT